MARHASFTPSFKMGGLVARVALIVAWLGIALIVTRLPQSAEVVALKFVLALMLVPIAGLLVTFFLQEVTLPRPGLIASRIYRQASSRLKTVRKPIVGAIYRPVPVRKRRQRSDFWQRLLFTVNSIRLPRVGVFTAVIAGSIMILSCGIFLRQATQHDRHQQPAKKQIVVTVERVHFYNNPKKVPLSKRRAIALEQHIQAASQKYGLDSSLVKAIVHQESKFNVSAVSPKGAEGLMQLMPTTARDVGVEDSFDPGDNLDGGAKYFRQLLDQFGGNVRLALAAYNAGPRIVEKCKCIPNNKETREYVPSVLSLYRQYRNGTL